MTATYSSYLTYNFSSNFKRTLGSVVLDERLDRLDKIFKLNSEKLP